MIASSIKSVGRRLSFGLQTSKFIVAQGKKTFLGVLMFQWWEKTHEERQFRALLLDILQLYKSSSNDLDHAGTQFTHISIKPFLFIYCLSAFVLMKVGPTHAVFSPSTKY